MNDDQTNHDDDRELPIEIPFVGDLTDHESELTERLLSVPPGGECTLFFDSPGGSPYLRRFAYDADGPPRRAGHRYRGGRMLFRRTVALCGLSAAHRNAL